MLPIGNRPVVDYVVQDCIAAGITDIYFIVGEDSTQLHAYYRPNLELNDYLRRNGKEDLLPLVETPQANFHFIVQPSYGKYGTAVPVALAMQAIEPDESVVVVSGDDLLYNPDGSSEIARLIDQTPAGECAILGVTVRDESVPRYGFIETNERAELIRIVEHPDPEPSVFIKNVSKYVLNYPMLEAIREYVEYGNPSGEYGIFDPFESVIAAGTVVKLVPATGQYLDAGTVEGWLHANQVVCTAEKTGPH
jgi:UTP--glucose-1-phosphate uridylyltransferase